MGFEFEGTIHQYQNMIQSEIRSFHKHFIDAWGVAENLKLRKARLNEYTLRLKTHQILKAGDPIDPSEHALVFKDGSIFSIAQTIKTPSTKKYIIEKSVVYFAKSKEINPGNKIVEYIFHYDKVKDIENHPDFHLQFDYNQEIVTPRFEIHNYVGIKEILTMIVRDQVLSIER